MERSLMAHDDKTADGTQLVPIGTVVARLRERYPDVTHSSLRFLEREGIVGPARTPGGHRLYSEADIARIVQVKEWQQQHLPLDVIRTRLDEGQEWANPSVLRHDFLERGLAGRFLGAGRRLVEANDRGVPMMDLFADVLEPALITVGNEWEEGTLLVAQEKQFSETSRDVIAELSQRHAWVDPDRPPILAACIKGTRHELGLRMIVGALRSEGWPVHFLGADVATSFLIEAVRLHHPGLVLLSVDSTESLPDLCDALDALRRETAGGARIPVVVGGRVSLAREVLAPYGETVVGGNGLRDVLAKVGGIMEHLPADKES